MRYATENDLPEIVAIYNSTVSARSSTADTSEVSVESRRPWFERHNPERRPLLVHEEDGEVAAWLSFESFYGRPAYNHTAEVSIYIHPSHRGKGLGRTLLDEAIERAEGLDIKTLVAFIFSHNEPSMRLFVSRGFAEWGRLPDVAEMDGKDYSLSILGRRLRK